MIATELDFSLDGFGGNGFRSCLEWLGWRVGLAAGAAREPVRVARALRELRLPAGPVASLRPGALPSRGKGECPGGTGRWRKALCASWPRLSESTTDRLRVAFDDLRERLYAHADRAADVELIDLRATITGETPKPALRPVPVGRGGATPAGRRPIHYRRQRYEAAVYLRGDLRAGQHLDGPAIVEQEDTTTLVPAGFRAEVDSFGNLVIEAR